MEAKGLKGFVLRWLGIEPAQQETKILVHEAVTHGAEVLKNQLWYRGDPTELEQYFKQLAEMEVNIYSTTVKSKFWASVPNGDVRIRKIHSGLPAMMVDTLSDIVVGDMLEPEMDAGISDRWEAFCKENDLEDIFTGALQEVLSSGDGAFKLNIDPELSDQPLLEFYGADKVSYEYKRGKLQAVVFKTEYCCNGNKYQLHERYSKGAVQYKLFGPNDKEYPLNTVPELADLEDVTFSGDYIMAVPLKIYKSTKYRNRGQAIYDKKSDAFDALDEILSTWVDGLRASRTKQYIPENLIPKDKEGIPLKPDVFNPWVAVDGSLAEDGKNKVETVQGNFATTALLESYMSFLDVCLQGILSPSTLGIDVKKLDNAEAQREKEKTTMYTRDTIIKAFKTCLEKLFNVILCTQDNMLGKMPPEEGYEATFEWGQYANPSFEAQVETLVKAKQGQIMSTEKIVDELYGDSIDEDEKAEEVARIKAEYGGGTEMAEPAVGDEEMFTEADVPGSEETATANEAISSAEQTTGRTLNGAQTQSLIQVMSQLSAGALSEGQATAIISTAIGVTREEAGAIIRGE